MAQPWLIYGSCMAHLWLIHGSIVAPPWLNSWLIYGSFVAHSWLIHGSIHGSSVAQPWLIQNEPIELNLNLLYLHNLTMPEVNERNDLWLILNEP